MDEGLSIQDYAKRVNALMAEKDRLEAELTDVNKAIVTVKHRMAEAMVDDDCAATSVDGYNFKLASKTYYTKKSDADIAEAGADYFTVLREEGLGDIIKPTVNARTLQSTIKAYMEEHDELSEGLAKIINVYTDDFEIERRKAPKPRKKTATGDADNIRINIEPAQMEWTDALPL